MQDTKQPQNQTIPSQGNTSPMRASQPQQAGRPVEPPSVSGNREHGPISTATSEFVKPAEPQPEMTPPAEVMIPPELKNIVEKGPDAKEPKIEKDMDQAGVKLAKESTPVITTPTGIIHVPMTYAQALHKEKSSPFWDSIHWIAALVMYQWRKYDSDNTKKN